MKKNINMFTIIIISILVINISLMPVTAQTNDVEILQVIDKNISLSVSIEDRDILDMLKAFSALYENHSLNNYNDNMTDGDLLTEYYIAAKAIEDETFEDYFKSVSWIDRSGEISLSIMPTNLLFLINNLNPAKFAARTARSFELLEDRFSTDSRWYNRDSLFAQYRCHVTFAGSLKTPWNIESFRTETDYLKVVAAGCNP